MGKKNVSYLKPTQQEHWFQTWLLRAGLLLVSAGIAYASVRAWKSSAAHAIDSPAPVVSQSAPAAFTQTKPAAPAPPGPDPEGMVWIPGGEFSMGCEDPSKLPHGGREGMPDARPIHRVSVDGFWMDRTEVTNRQYAAFAKATRYITVAERTPTATEFPDAPPENLVAGSVVFAPTPQKVPLDNHYRWWSYVKGGELAASRGAREQHRGPRRPSGHAHCLRRRPGLREVGRQAAPDRSRMGVCRAGRRRRNALLLG